MALGGYKAKFIGCKVNIFLFFSRFSTFFSSWLSLLSFSTWKKLPICTYAASYPYKCYHMGVFSSYIILDCYFLSYLSFLSTLISFPSLHILTFNCMHVVCNKIFPTDRRDVGRKRRMKGNKLILYFSQCLKLFYALLCESLWIEKERENFHIPDNAKDEILSLLCTIHEAINPFCSIDFFRLSYI